MHAIWQNNVEIQSSGPLAGDCKTDVLVIGAGLCGLLCAYFLQQHGLQVLVIDRAHAPCSGATARTTAKVTIQHNLTYHRLITSLGKARAAQYAHLNMCALEQYRALVQQQQIACDWQTLPSYVFSRDDAARMRQEVEAACSLGIDAQFTTETTLPFAVQGAVRFSDQAQFDPLRFAAHIAQGLTIHTRTCALAIKDQVVETDRGNITASHIVVATHFPFVNAPGFYFMRMHQQRSYVLALENAPQLDGMYIDADPDGYSFRNARGLLLFGGAGHRTGKNPSGGHYEALREAARALYPDSSEAAAWSNQDCMTLDGVPYIGYYSRSKAPVYVATGFNKWGMTSSMAAALLLSDVVTGRENPDAVAFSPQRLTISASMRRFLINGGETAIGFTKRMLDTLDTLDNQLSHVRKGEGAVLVYGDEKVGVYRDEDDELYLVRPRCPHLGCQLEWNGDDHTWDCPCHGSRFDVRGNVLDGPATQRL
nr:FAD-dependent oxidoreductase [Maliibacterium massiliense]